MPEPEPIIGGALIVGGVVSAVIIVFWPWISHLVDRADANEKGEAI